MKVVVTGATGFIGNHVISYLINQNVDIYATSTSTDKAMKMPWFDKVNYQPFLLGNVMSDGIVDFFRDADVVIHLAWQGLPDFKSENHLKIYLPDQKKFILQLSELNIKRLINIGTCLEYGMQEGELTEDMPVYPVVNYAIAKNQLRIFVDDLKSKFKNGTCWLRLFYMYGEGQSAKSLLPQLNQAILEKKEYFDMSDGLQERDYLPVEKVSEYIVRIALNNNAQGIINCSSGKPIKIRTFVNEFINSMGAKIKLNYGALPYPEYEPRVFYGNNEKLNNLLKNEI